MTRGVGFGPALDEFDKGLLVGIALSFQRRPRLLTRYHTAAARPKAILPAHVTNVFSPDRVICAAALTFPGEIPGDAGYDVEPCPKAAGGVRRPGLCP